MEQLPDDVLAVVMQYVGVEDLLACRLVSKRIGALALHPDAWRRRRLGLAALDFDIKFHEDRCLCSVLRLAPCVAVLARYRTTRRGRRLPCRLAETSMRCAAGEIWIDLRRSSSRDVSGLIRRQGELGRLKVIRMNVFGAVPVAAALEAAVSVPGLRGLEVRTIIPLHGEEFDVFPVMATPALHTLKHLTCSLCPKSERFVNSILAEHATTIEKVDLLGQVGHRLLGRQTSTLLAGMTHLRELGCPALPGLEAVAACCESLRTLRLTFSYWDGHHAAAGAAELLRRAEHLRDVTLSYWPVVGSPAAVGVDLVLALAGSTRSRLERLSILPIMNINSIFGQLDQSHLLQPLLRALPSLPALQHLSLQVDPDELLLAINPATTPALQSVTVTLPGKQCAHAWLHGDAVKAALQANPSLHVEFSALLASCFTVCRPSCERACALGCHEELPKKIRNWYLGLFSHDPKLKCSHIHKTEIDRELQRLWVHIS